MNNESRKYKVIDLFCGVGGFRLGFPKSKFKFVFSSDFDKNCQIVYQNNFDELPKGDITKIDVDEIPDFDILTGGFPCQPFSISGKKKGFEDTRGTLFFDICRIIQSKSPKVVVLENVKHFINHDKKRTLSTVIQSLTNLGYNTVYKVLNTSDFGLPQNRERVFIIGTKRGVFDFSKINFKKSKPLKDFLDKDGDFEYLEENEYTLLDNDLVKIQPHSNLIFVGYRNKKGFRRGIRPGTSHLNRSHRQPNRIYSVEGYHPTLPSQESSGRFFIYLPKINKVRKLTISECYRIMGFPKNFKLHETKGHQYRQIGNSVGVSVIEEISKQLIEQKLLSESYSHKYKGLDSLLFQDHV